jgi:hypothetical protein
MMLPLPQKTSPAPAPESQIRSRSTRRTASLIEKVLLRGLTWRTKVAMSERTHRRRERTLR